MQNHIRSFNLNIRYMVGRTGRDFFLGGGGGGGQFSRESASLYEYSYRPMHAQYACYRTLHSAVLITDSFVKYRKKARHQCGIE